MDGVIHSYSIHQIDDYCFVLIHYGYFNGIYFTQSIRVSQLHEDEIVDHIMTNNEYLFVHIERELHNNTEIFVKYSIKTSFDIGNPPDLYDVGEIIDSRISESESLDRRVPCHIWAICLGLIVR